MPATLETLVDAIDRLRTGHLLVVTGAGISHASGISTFRGSEPGAVWKTSDVSLATRECLQRDPVIQWQWYLQRFQAVRHARPNPGHLALAQLVRVIARRGGSLDLVTQNIDTLHEQAGSRDLIKVHGTADRIRCSRNGCVFGAPSGSLALEWEAFDAFLEDPIVDNLPLCPRCSAMLRAHVLFFDEYYLEHQDYRFPEAEQLAERADLILFVGTSFSVGVTDLYLRAGNARGIEMWSIDPLAVDQPETGVQPIPLPAEEALPYCCRVLGEHEEQRQPMQRGGV